MVEQQGQRRSGTPVPELGNLMAKRRRGALTSAAKRHSRIINPADRSKYVYYRCWMCGTDVVIDTYAGTNLNEKKRVGQRGPFLLCLNCKFGKRLDYGRRFVQMFLLIRKVSNEPCRLNPGPDLEQTCPCLPCVASRLTYDIEAERPSLPQKLFRKKVRVDPEGL